MSQQLEKELEHVKLGIYDLVKGKLSPFILSPHVLKSSIGQVQHIISSKFPHFHISNTNPLYYYSFGDFIFTRMHSNLYLTLKIPISPFLQHISIYKIYSFPVPVNSSSNHATQLLDTPEYFLKRKSTLQNNLFHLTDTVHRNNFTVMHLQHCINSLRITKLSVGHLLLPERCSEQHV